MGKYLKLFETHSQYTTFTQTQDFILPNVSYCLDQTDVVHYNPFVPPVLPLMVTYNVEDASSPTQLYFYYEEQGEPSALGVDMFDKVEIDGTEVSVSSLDADEGAYQFSTGEHTVAYTLKNPTLIGFEPGSEGSTFGAVFMECASITNTEIPNSVTTIGDSAFNGCRGLTSVTIPNSVTTIGDNAFVYCFNLTSVTIPNSVTTIGGGAFCDCRSLTSITIPNSVTTIDYAAFGYCPLDNTSVAAIQAINPDGTAPCYK